MRLQLDPFSPSGVSIVTEQKLTNKGGFAGSPDITRVLQPGTNVTFTGSGTQQSPYVVNSSGSGGSIPSATYTTQGKVLQQVYNVRDYGATGNGSTVDSTSVQSAVTATLGAGGGIIFFPPGTYVMSGVTFGSNIMVVGAGQGNTILLMDPTATTGSVVSRVAPASSVTATSEFMMKDLTIDGNKSTWGANNNQKGYGFYMGQGTNGLITNCSMENVEIQNCMTYAFDVENVQNVRLINCVAHDNGYSSGTGTNINCDGFTLIGDDITVIGCNAYNNAVFGFRAGQSSVVWHRIVISECRAWSNGSVGIALGSSAGFGIYDSHIIGCMSYSNGASGIYLDVDAFSCSVEGSSSYNNATNGILVATSAYCAIIGNTIENNATAASSNPEIYLTSTSTHNTVTGNTVNSTTATHAISEQNSSTDFNVIANNVVTSTSTTIVVNGINTYISENQGFTADVGPSKTFTGKAIVPSLQVTTTPTSGYVLTADVSGNATWQPSSGSGGSGITRNISSISTATTAASTALTDYVYLVSGTTTLTLPTAVSNTNAYGVKNSGTAIITIATTSAQTIDGNANITLTANQFITIYSNNSNWIIGA